MLVLRQKSGSIEWWDQIDDPDCPHKPDHGDRERALLLIHAMRHDDSSKDRASIRRHT